MPLPISHGIVGASIVAALHPKPTKRYFVPLFIGAFLANAADLDFIFVFLFQSKSWHRGFTHSILFALLVCSIFLLVAGKRHFRAALAYGLAYSSHFILDYVTTKNGGVELFWFFSSEMWKLGWFALSESPSKMSIYEIFQAIVIEILLFTPLLALTIYLRKYISLNRSKTTDSI
jgi:inner membrane protein